MAEIKVEKTIYELLQEVRDELLNNSDLKKSGKGTNGKRDYSYFELADFLPKATKLFRERCMCPVVSVGYDQNGVEIATMKIIKGTESIIFTLPTAEAVVSSNPIQNQGGKLTYMRRYLYQMALDLVENDLVDMPKEGKQEAEEKKATVEEKKATEKQVDLIRKLFEQEKIAMILEHFNIQSLEELSLKDASTLIAKKREKQ